VLTLSSDLACRGTDQSDGVATAAVSGSRRRLDVSWDTDPIVLRISPETFDDSYEVAFDLFPIVLSLSRIIVA